MLNSWGVLGCAYMWSLHQNATPGLSWPCPYIHQVYGIVDKVCIDLGSIHPTTNPSMCGHLVSWSFRIYQISEGFLGGLKYGIPIPRCRSMLVGSCPYIHQMDGMDEKVWIDLGLIWHITNPSMCCYVASSASKLCWNAVGSWVWIYGISMVWCPSMLQAFQT